MRLYAVQSLCARPIPEAFIVGCITVAGRPPTIKKTCTNKIVTRLHVAFSRQTFAGPHGKAARKIWLFSSRKCFKHPAAARRVSIEVGRGRHENRVLR